MYVKTLLQPWTYIDEEEYPSLTEDLAKQLADLRVTQTQKDVHAALFPKKKSKRVGQYEKANQSTTPGLSTPLPESTDQCTSDSSFEIISSESEDESNTVDQNNNAVKPSGARAVVKPSGVGQYRVGSLPWPEQHPNRFLLDSTGPQRNLTRLSRPMMPTVYRDLDSSPQYEGIYHAIVNNSLLTYGFRFGLRQAELMDRNELLEYRDDLDYEHYSELDETNDYDKIYNSEFFKIHHVSLDL